MNELDGDWYEERNPDHAGPEHRRPGLASRSTRAADGPSTARIELFDTLKGPKKLDIGPYPPMQSRPWVEEHDKMFRWYDYWLKGIDNGVMDEPAVNVFVEGTRRGGDRRDWPPKRGRVQAAVPAPAPQAVVRARAAWAWSERAPDGFYQAPLTITDKVEMLSWCTEPVPGADGDDRCRCRAPLRGDRPGRHELHPAHVGRGPERQAPAGHDRLTSRPLTASSTNAPPRATPTTRTPARCRSSPGKIEEYVLRLYPFAATFKPRPQAGGRTLLQRAAGGRAQLAAAAGRLPPAGRAARSTHKIYRDAAHPSRLVLPFTTRKAEETK